AYVWASKAGDVEAAKAALAQAGAHGVASGVLSHIARTLASLRGDAAWYEEATKELLAADADAGAEVDAGDRASLWLELGRSRLLRADEAGAREAFSSLAAEGAQDGAPGRSAWLGHVLGAYA